MSYTIHPSEIQLGVCRLSYLKQNLDSSEWVDIGETTGGTTLIYSPMSAQESEIIFGIDSKGLNKLIDYTMPIKLRVHPVNHLGVNGIDDNTYDDDDITIWKAGEIKAKETLDHNKIYRVTMKMFPDFSKSVGRYLFAIGDTGETNE